MSDCTHWDGCWYEHHQCARIHIRAAEAEIERLRAIDNGTKDSVSRVAYDTLKAQRDHWKEQAETLQRLLDRCQKRLLAQDAWARSRP